MQGAGYTAPVPNKRGKTMIEASQNPDLVASELLRYAQRGYMPVFDIDGVLFDATHRQATLPDGSLNLEKYRELATPENIAKDRPLPLIGAAPLHNLLQMWILLLRRQMSLLSVSIVARSCLM